MQGTLKVDYDFCNLLADSTSQLPDKMKGNVEENTTKMKT